jgi:hypothetical protein
MTRALALVAVSLAACKPIPPGDDDGLETTGSTGDTTDDPTTTPTTGHNYGDEFEVDDFREVDLLFVIDNSGSMSHAQSRLAAAAPALLDALEGAAQPIDLRIAFTTTDAGNPRCPGATYTPERGRLVLSSCVDRMAQGEFIFNQEDHGFACVDNCSLADADLPISPSATQYSNGELAPRSWIESTAGRTNLPAGVSLAQAFKCFAPMGVAGCGFEAPLESMFLALAQASREDAPTNYGFLRDAATLAIVIVSDETDCSATDLGADIFTTNKVFWNDPSDPAPTSAACWRAGVTCQGAGPTYDTCFADNHGLDGSPAVADADAVLQPLARYIDFVTTLENDRKKHLLDLEVLVTLLTSVPDGYEDGLAELIYTDSADDHQLDFGVGPGCIDTEPPYTVAVPPVREREFAEAFQVGDERNLSSICAKNFSPAMTRLGQRIADQIQPTCVQLCVKDTNPSTPLVEADCHMSEILADKGEEREVPPCDVVGDAFVVPAGETVCFGLRTDGTDLTPSSLDDLHPRCAFEGFNAEFVIVRTGPKPPLSRLRAACEQSPNKAYDCPDL